MLSTSEWNDAELKKNLYYNTLSDQPIGRDRRDPPRPRVLLMDVDLDLRAAPAGNEATLTVVETLVPIGQPLAALRAGPRSRRSTRSFGHNLTKRREHLLKVTDEAGRSCPSSTDYDEVAVQLAEPAPPIGRSS